MFLTPPPRAGAGVPSSVLPSQSIRRFSLQHLPTSDLNLPGWLLLDGRRSLPRGRSRLPALIPAAARGSAWLPAEPSHLRDRLAAPIPVPCFFKRSFCTQAFMQCLQPCVVRWSRSCSPRLSLLGRRDEGCACCIHAFDQLPWLNPVLSCTARTRCYYFFSLIRN